MKRFLRVLAAVVLLSPLAGCGPYYDDCGEARAAGVAPLHRGDQGYGRHLDRDGDGVACS